MSQRDSGYTRQERDCYQTPAWATHCVVDHIDDRFVWEPAAGSGKMSAALRERGFTVWESDIDAGRDFLTADSLPDDAVTAIVTNPPYELAEEFIVHSLFLTKQVCGAVAMLLRCDYDHAKTRADLFGGSSIFAKKVVLTKRIKWFEDSTGSPSFNHSWYVWDWRHQGPPTLAYAP